MLEALVKFVPDSLRPAYLGLLAQIPDYARHIAVVGESCGTAGYLLKKRPGVHVTGLVSGSHAAGLARQILDRVISSEAELARLPDEELDVILLCNLEAGLAEAMEWLALLAPKLRAQGQVYALFAAPAWAQLDGRDLAALELQVMRGLCDCGFGLYLRWPLNEPCDGGVAARGLLLSAVSPDYSPVLRARELRAAGLSAAAYQELDAVPEGFYAEVGALEAKALEKLLALEDWIRLAQGHDTSVLLSRALDEFYILTDENPLNPDSYLAMADCWAAGGDTELAVRVLRNIHHVAPSEATKSKLEHLETGSTNRFVEWPPEPAWQPSRPLRILFLINPRPHYGLDVLFDGLCACLGDENVVDYPWKPTVHGGETAEHRHYPCRFNRKGAPHSVTDICSALGSEHFDAILYGDLEDSLPAGEFAAILQARGDCPIFLVDALDQMGNFKQRVIDRTGFPDFAGYFKREMHRCVDYGSNAWPMPFAYAAELGLQEPVGDRPHDFFWAGHRHFGQRRLYLGALERRYGWNLDQRYDQAEYQARIRDSRIGLNCFGLGFDTVRYWELPAQGCMLLSDRPPIQIPQNFEDGVHAVFFDDVGDLMQKLDYYLKHPNEAKTIAEAGRRHFQRFHTNQARASQVLGRIQSVLGVN